MLENSIHMDTSRTAEATARIPAEGGQTSSMSDVDISSCAACGALFARDNKQTGPNNCLGIVIGHRRFLDFSRRVVECIYHSTFTFGPVLWLNLFP